MGYKKELHDFCEGMKRYFSKTIEKEAVTLAPHGKALLTPSIVCCEGERLETKLLDNSAVPKENKLLPWRRTRQRIIEGVKDTLKHHPWWVLLEDPVVLQATWFVRVEEAEQPDRENHSSYDGLFNNLSSLLAKELHGSVAEGLLPERVDVVLLADNILVLEQYLQPLLARAQLDGTVPVLSDVRVYEVYKTTDGKQSEYFSMLLARHIWKNRSNLQEVMSPGSKVSDKSPFPDAKALEGFKKLRDVARGQESLEGSGKADALNIFDYLCSSFRLEPSKLGTGKVVGDTSDANVGLRYLEMIQTSTRRLGLHCPHEFRLSPLSLITGANRSGKSTLVEAIGVGLSGQRYRHDSAMPALPPRLEGLPKEAKFQITPKRTSGNNTLFKTSVLDMELSEPDPLFPDRSAVQYFSPTTSGNVRVAVTGYWERELDREALFKGRRLQMDAMWLPSEWIAEFARKAWHRHYQFHLSQQRSVYAEAQYMVRLVSQERLDPAFDERLRVVAVDCLRRWFMTRLQALLDQITSKDDTGFSYHKVNKRAQKSLARMGLYLLWSQLSDAGELPPLSDFGDPVIEDRIERLFGAIGSASRETEVGIDLKARAITQVFGGQPLKWPKSTVELRQFVLLLVAKRLFEIACDSKAIVDGQLSDEQILGAIFPFGSAQLTELSTELGAVAGSTISIDGAGRDTGNEALEDSQTRGLLVWWSTLFQEWETDVDNQDKDKKKGKKNLLTELYSALRPFQWTWEHWSLETTSQGFYQMNHPKCGPRNGLDMLNYGDMLAITLGGQVLAWLANSNNGSSVLVIDDCFSGVDPKQGIFFGLLLGRLRRLMGAHIQAAQLQKIENDVSTLPAMPPAWAQVIVATVETLLAHQWQALEATPDNTELIREVATLWEVCNTKVIWEERLLNRLIDSASEDLKKMLFRALRDVFSDWSVMPKRALFGLLKSLHLIRDRKDRDDQSIKEEINAPPENEEKIVSFEDIFAEPTPEEWKELKDDAIDQIKNIQKSFEGEDDWGTIEVIKAILVDADLFEAKFKKLFIGDKAEFSLLSKRQLKQLQALSFVRAGNESVGGAVINLLPIEKEQADQNSFVEVPPLGGRWALSVDALDLAQFVSVARGRD